ncbi:MAG: SDR family oxidoreductase [Dermatophilaceae bacterium]
MDTNSTRHRDLAGTVAVVTGASSGIGEATARALAGQGATVALLARRGDRLRALAGDLAGGPGSAEPVEVDVTDAAAVRMAIDDIAERHGRLDVLVNNAGVARSTLAADADLTDWRTMVDVNLGGVLGTTHAALRHLVATAAEHGVADLVTVSSASGRRVPKPESNVYAATKHAVCAFSEALRQELGPQQVRVGLVEPGFVVTEMTATEGREFGELDALQATDIADSILFMLTRHRRHGINEMLMRAIGQRS